MWCFLHNKNGMELNSKSASYEFSLLPRKLSQMRWFTITRVCHPTISVTQEPRCGLAGCSPVSRNCSRGVVWAVFSPGGPNGEESTSRST